MLAMLKNRLLAATTMLLVCCAATAAPATYRFTGDIVGTLAGVPVSGLLTLDVTGDTNDITQPASAHILNSLGTSTFTLASVGSFTVSNEAYVFSRPDTGFVGFGVRDLVSCCDIIQIANPVFSGYDLRTALGPVGGPDNPSLADWVNVPTSAGAFTVTRMTSNTFQAIIGAEVPEPGLPALLALAGGLAWWSGRGRKAAQRADATA
jgi:hypothetical protein